MKKKNTTINNKNKENVNKQLLKIYKNNIYFKNI